MRRAILVKMGKRILLGIILIAVSAVITSFRLNTQLLALKFDGLVDMAYVIFVALIPHIIYWAGYSVAFSAGIMLLKYRFMPVHRMEKNYLGLSRSSVKKAVFMCALLVLPLFALPMLPARMMAAGEVVRGADQILGQFTFTAVVIPFIGQMLGALAALADFFLVKPLYLLSAFRLDTAIAALIAASILYHTISVGVARRKLSVNRSVSSRFCMAGEKFEVGTSFTCPLPMPSVFITETSTPRKKLGYSRERKENFLCTEMTVKEKMTLPEGMYQMDILPVTVFTLPCFHTKLYRVSGSEASVSIAPAIHYKTRMFIKRPVVSRETGSLLKRQLGSSMEFAGMREYAVGDPLGRIWWKGLAKTGKMLVKEYQAFAEDRWMLALDFTNSGAKEAGVKDMLQFARIFIELCTRKDISIGLSSFAPSFQFSDYSSSRRELLMALSRFNVPMHEISPKGIEGIMKDALGSGFDDFVARCRRGGVSLPMAYAASGLGKQAAFFSWKREAVFAGSTKNFFRKMRKSGKIILVTDGRFRSMEPFKRFRSICGMRNYNYVVVLTCPDQDVADRFRKEKIRHIVVPSGGIASPGFVLNLVGRF